MPFYSQSMPPSYEDLEFLAQSIFQPALCNALSRLYCCVADSSSLSCWASSRSLGYSTRNLIHLSRYPLTNPQEQSPHPHTWCLPPQAERRPCRSCKARTCSRRCRSRRRWANSWCLWRWDRLQLCRLGSSPCRWDSSLSSLLCRLRRAPMMRRLLTVLLDGGLVVVLLRRGR